MTDDDMDYVAKKQILIVIAFVFVCILSIFFSGMINVVKVIFFHDGENLSCGDFLTIIILIISSLLVLLKMVFEIDKEKYIRSIQMKRESEYKPSTTTDEHTFYLE